MKYVVVYEQEEEGCGHMIGCGTKVEVIEADNYVAALAKCKVSWREMDGPDDTVNKVRLYRVIGESAPNVDLWRDEEDEIDDVGKPSTTGDNPVAARGPVYSSHSGMSIEADRNAAEAWREQVANGPVQKQKVEVCQNCGSSRCNGKVYVAGEAARDGYRVLVCEKELEMREGRLQYHWVMGHGTSWYVDVRPATQGEMDWELKRRAEINKRNHPIALVDGDGEDDGSGMRKYGKWAHAATGPD